MIKFSNFGKWLRFMTLNYPRESSGENFCMDIKWRVYRKKDRWFNQRILKYRAKME